MQIKIEEKRGYYYASAIIPHRDFKAVFEGTDMGGALEALGDAMAEALAQGKIKEIDLL